MNTKEDKEIIESIENGEWKSIENLEEMKKKLIIAASETAIKDYM